MVQEADASGRKFTALNLLTEPANAVINKKI